MATSPALQGVNSAYFEDCNPVTASGDHHMFDALMAERLGGVAATMTGDYLPYSDLH